MNFQISFLLVVVFITPICTYNRLMHVIIQTIIWFMTRQK